MAEKESHLLTIPELLAETAVTMEYDNATAAIAATVSDMMEDVLYGVLLEDEAYDKLFNILVDFLCDYEDEANALIREYNENAAEFEEARREGLRA